MSDRTKPALVAVKMIRMGVELATHRPAMGEVVHVPERQAEELVRNSAAVYIEDSI